MAETLRNQKTTTNKPQSQESTALDRICEMLEAGKSREEIAAAMQEGALLPGLEPLNAGIIRTRKGALMVRVSDDRWPIAMYAKDWKILIAKLPAIKEALENLDILEENPDPTPKQRELPPAVPATRTA